MNFFNNHNQIYILQSICKRHNKISTKMLVKSMVSRVNTFVKAFITLSSSKIMYCASFDCNNCSKKSTIPECKACDRMVNYFQIFDIPQQFKVNQQKISFKAKELQKQYHPDKHSFNQNMEKIFKDNMIKYSAYINQAKSTLLDDLKRATYMMQLRGVQIQDSTQIQDNNFMIQMFNLQEQIEQGSQDTCQQIKRRIEGIMENIQVEFDNFFKTQDMKKCKEFVFKYKYLHRALQNVNQKLNAIQMSQH